MIHILRSILPVNQNPLLDLIRQFDPNLGESSHDFKRYSGGEFSPTLVKHVKDHIVYVQVADIGQKRPEELYMRAMFLADNAIQNGAADVILWAPETHYLRADKPEENKPFTARLMAEIFNLRFSKVLTTHIHSEKAAEIFAEVYGRPRDQVVYDIDPIYIYLDHFSRHINLIDTYGKNLCVWIADHNSTPQGMHFIDGLKNLGLTDLSWIQCNKYRKIPNDRKSVAVEIASTSSNFPGSLEGMVAWNVDDSGDTIGTQEKQLKAATASFGIPKMLISYLTHPILSGDADSRIFNYGINIITSNSHPNISYRSGAWTKYLGILDFTPAWFVGMKEAVEPGVPMQEVMERYHLESRTNKLYRIEKESQFLPLNRDYILNGKG